MKLLTTFLVFFASLSFNPVAYSAIKDNPLNAQINIQQLANETEQSEDDDDSEC